MGAELFDFQRKNIHPEIQKKGNFEPLYFPSGSTNIAENLGNFSNAINNTLLKKIFWRWSRKNWSFLNGMINLVCSELFHFFVSLVLTYRYPLLCHESLFHHPLKKSTLPFLLNKYIYCATVFKNYKNLKFTDL